MDLITKQGRPIFALTVVFLGAENAIVARAAQPYLPVLPFVPGYPLLGYLMGAVLIALGLGILTRYRGTQAALALAILMALCVLLLQTPLVVHKPLDVGIRTTFFETLSFCAVALALTGTPLLIDLGRWLFAVSSIVFGIDHFLVLDFIASLVPSWIPLPMFWAYLTGIVFIVAGVTFATKYMGRWGGLMLATMFGLWFLLLHAPRVASPDKIHNPDEWSSAFIALAICGGSLVMARVSKRSLHPRRSAQNRAREQAAT
jgi:hypothetical protein